MLMYMEGKDDTALDENQANEENSNLPKVKEGDTLHLRKLVPQTTLYATTTALQ